MKVDFLTGKKFQGVVSLYDGKAYNALPGAHPS